MADPKIPVKKLYRPDYEPVDPDLNRSTGKPSKTGVPRQTFEEARGAAEQELRRLKRIRLDGGKANQPKTVNPQGSRLRPSLTFEEAVVVEARKDELIARIRETRSKVAATRSTIDELLRGDGTALSFDIDIERLPQVKRAIKKAFGINNPTTISYPMYKAALAARRELEQREADDYTSGNWGEEEEE